MTRTRVVYLMIGLCLAAAGLLAGCGCGSHPAPPAAIEAGQSGPGIDLILANQPVPAFAYSAFRQNLIMIEAIQALGSPTTSFFMPVGSTVIGNVASAPPMASCPSEGEPIPYGTQLSNPEQIVKDTNPGHNNSTSLAIPQMDPNGVYEVGGASTGTHVLCVSKAGKPDLAYWEGPVFNRTGTWVYDASSRQFSQAGPSALPVCTLQTYPPGGPHAGHKYYHCVKAPGT